MKEDFIAKIEGHGRLRADWKRHKVVLEIHEGERLFEGIVVGRPALEAPWITARICGVCPIAHNLCAFKAVEDAFGVKVREEVVILRRLLFTGQMLQSHALHFYFLALPDYLGLDSGLEIKETHPQYFKAALTLKEVSDKISHVVGGRTTHPTTTNIGSFHKTPSKNALETLRKEIQRALPAAEKTARLATGLEYPEFELALNLLSQVGEEEFNVYKSPFVQGEGEKTWSSKNYKKMINEEIRSFSTAKLGFHKGRPAMVGALARIRLQKEKLNPRAKGFLKKTGINYQNPFHNNLAQAIETVHFAEEALALTNTLLKRYPSLKALKSPKPKLPKGKKTGIGAVEAPRGGLYHEYTIDQKGLITAANVITPTVQNLGSLEATAQALAEETKAKKRREREKLIEMLIRAYDPCITCSVH